MRYILPFLALTFSVYSEVAMDQKEATPKNVWHAIAPNPFVISADTVEEITKNEHLNVEELLQLLIPIAKSYALPPISNYYVGAAVLAKSGAIYLGVNLEFLGFPLHQSVHGEQFAITNARSHGETESAISC